MEFLRCFLCGERIPNGLNGLSSHFISTHGLTVKRGIGNKGFTCGQDNCRRQFSQFSSMRKHINEKHTNNNHNVYDERRPNYVNDFNEHDERRPDYNDLNLNDFNDNDQNMEDNQNVEDNLNMENNNEINNDEFQERFYFDMQTFITRMIGRLRCNGSMTGSMITTILDEYEQLMFFMRDFLKQEVANYIINRQLLTNEGLNELQKIFDFKNPFHGLRTLDQQIDSLRLKCNYIDPEEIPLGYRIDNCLDSKTCTYVPKMVMETFQYVSPIKVLTQIMKSDEIREAILNERKSPEGVKTSFIDGEHFKVHPLFSRYPHALRLKLYYDEFEIVNPLGSKTCIHKLGAFYYVIDNLPAHMNSELSDIHVLLLCCDADVKKYGFEAILGPFLNDDLVKLESDEGVQIQIGENEEDIFILRASISGFCGDGLAVHEVFNLLSPSAKHFCRMCTISRENFHIDNDEVSEQRTEHLYDQHIDLLQQNNFSDKTMTETGMKGECCLNTSRFFHSTRNKIFDIFHEILAGVGPMILKLVLHELIFEKNNFNIDYFNGKVFSFNYGYVEIKNKPSANFTESMLKKKEHTLSQKGIQMWLLLRAFPFLVAENVQRDDEHLQLVLQLLRIMELLFAPKIIESLIPYLRALIKDFLMAFRRLFPNVNPINKMHHMTHFPDCIMWSGPMPLYNCVRFEAKHSEGKSHAENVNNFKNPPKTIIRIYQCSQSSKWGVGDVKLNRFQVLSGSTDLVENSLSKDDLYELGYIDSDRIFLSSSVGVNGTEYRVGLYVCLEVASLRDNDLPLFGKIEEIVILEGDKVYFKISVCTTTEFNTNLNAYCIDDAGDGLERFIKVTDLAHYKPFSCWSHADQLFISLRHVLL